MWYMRRRDTCSKATLKGLTALWLFCARTVVNNTCILLQLYLPPIEMSKRNQFNARLTSFSCLIELHGIHKQASVGFLTLMESLRYCKVTKLNCSYGRQKVKGKSMFTFPELWRLNCMDFYMSKILGVWEKISSVGSQLIALQGKHVHMDGICFMSLCVSQAGGIRNKWHTHWKICSVELGEHALIKANNPFTAVAGGRFIYTRGFNSTFCSSLQPSVILPFAVVIMRKIREVDQNGA